MKDPRQLYGTLCKPAQFYLVISIVAFVLMAIQNLGATSSFTLGNYSTPHSNPALILFFNALYIALWTWMLNVICRLNPNISWFIVLLPFILFFIGVMLVLFKGK
jgi:hypothetical protein